jgi:soluble cytochrome b562
MNNKDLIEEISNLRNSVDIHLSHIQNTVAENNPIGNEIPAQIRAFRNQFDLLAQQLDEYSGTFDHGNIIVAVNTLGLENNVFWSNRNGELPLKTVLACVVDGRFKSDLMTLQIKFGDEIIREVFDRHYQGELKHDHLIKHIIYGKK